MKPHKLVWNEGLFLTQHHFQQVDRYHEWLVHERVHAVSPYGWGISDMQVDDRALASGQFKVTRLSGIFPDGSPFEAGDSGDDALPARNCAVAFSPQTRALDVYVALAQENQSIANVELDGNPASFRRHLREESTVLDLNSGTNEHPISWARKNLRFLFGDERREAFDYIRIAQLVRSASGAIVQRPDFVPPVLHLRASHALSEKVRELLTAMVSKQQAVASMRRQRTTMAVDIHPADSSKFWLLNSLNSFIPVFSHLIDQPQASPEALYLALAQLTGHLCTLASNEDPVDQPKFNYVELGDVLLPMIERIMRLMDTVIAERYVQIPLDRKDERMYVGKITDSALFQCEFFVGVSGNIPEAIVRERIPKLAKVASVRHIESILNSALNGARLELEFRPPGALPLRPGLVFFRVQRGNEYWEDVVSTGSVALYHPLESDAVTLTLYAVDPANI